MLSTLFVAVALLGAPLGVGDPAPRLVFKDIDGRKGTSDEFKDWIIVYSFANRESSDALMAWRDPAQLSIVKAHPKLKIANINFADVSGVPRMFRGIVKPILGSINSRATKRMLETFQKADVLVDPSLSQFFLIPEWSGEYLKIFGLQDAAMYRCWIVKDGKVVAVVDAKTPDVEKAYVKWFEGFETSSPSRR